MADAHANFAVSTVATAPSPATSGTSLSVASGEGARFPAVPFNATVRPIGAPPDPSNAEIIRVTARTGDSFGTIVRAQEGSSARAIQAGDHISATVTAKSLTDVETDAANALSGYQFLRGAGVVVPSATAAGTWVIYEGGTALALGAAASAFPTFRLDPADHPATGRTVKVRLRGHVITSSVAPGNITFTLTLSPVTGWGGASNSRPTVTTLGSAVCSVAITNPPSGGPTTGTDSEATFPAAGHYALTVTTSGTSATNSQTECLARLDVRVV